MAAKSPDPLARWVDRLADVCRLSAIGAKGLYLSGSLCTGGFQAELSDLDLVLVVNSALDASQLEIFCSDLIELGLPPTAGGLDLDIFTGLGLQHPDPDPGWRSWIRWTAGGSPVGTEEKLQLSDWAPALAIARDWAIPVFGRPAVEVVAPVPPHLLLQAGREELAEWDHYQAFWSLAGGVLTACRVWWYWAEGRLGSKLEAGSWALDHVRGEERALIQNALRQQATGVEADLTAIAVIAFVGRVAVLVGAAA